MGWFNDNMDSDSSEFGSKDPANHIDPATGYIKTGYRKCSHCTSYKYRTGFTKEEATKPAAKRLCNDCIVSGATTVKSKPKAPSTTKTSAATTSKAVIPQLDIECMSIKEMKEELESHGVCTKAMIEKSELIDALTNARGRSKCSSQTLVDIQALTVQGLKEELKSRGLPVSGLKAVLQQRLIDAVGVSTCTTESSDKEEASTEEIPVKKTVAPEKTASKDQDKENIPQTNTKEAKKEKNGSKKNAKKKSKEQNKEKERVKRCSSYECNNILLNKYTQICGMCVEAKQFERSSAGGGNGNQPKLPYPCKFFAIGQCRYGDACRFSHAQPAGATGFGGNSSAGGHGQTYRGSIWSHPDVIAGMKSYRASKPSWDWNR